MKEIMKTAIPPKMHKQEETAEAFKKRRLIECGELSGEDYQTYRNKLLSEKAIAADKRKHDAIADGKPFKK